MPQSVTLISQVVQSQNHRTNNYFSNTQNISKNFYTNEKSEKNLSNFKVLNIGDRVFHQKFGYGEIILLDGDNLEINFEKTGSKKVKADFVAKKI